MSTKKYEHEIQKILDMGIMIDTIQKGISIRHPVDFRLSSEPEKSLEIICFKFSVDIFNAYLNRTIMQFPQQILGKYFNKNCKNISCIVFPLGTSSEIQFLSQRKTISQTESENESRTEASAIYHPTQLSHMCGYCGDEMGLLEDSHRICINISCRNYKNKDDIHIENLWKL
eukprot:gene6848-11009_t